MKANNNEDIWDEIPKIEIGIFPWDTNGYKPESEAQMFYTDVDFRLRLSSKEKNIRAVNLNMNENVYEDSCLEFFLLPGLLGERKYMNFEFNALGVLLLGIGDGRNNRIHPKINPDKFEIKASLNIENMKNYNGDLWTIEFKIPFDFLEEHYGRHDFLSGYKMKANFYKCGDKTEYPHYGCWNPIENLTPDFHLPQYFGELILE